MEVVSFLRAIVAGAIVLGVLVLVHEWGHFIAAKLCGVRVDVFSIGFGNRVWGVKRGDTDYRISALPLGGYVRMAGDNPVEERTGAPYEFLSRPRWQRFLIAIAGPATNIILTVLILWGIYASVSIPFVPPTIDQVQAGSAAEKSGLKSGDVILAIDGKTVKTSSEFVDAVRASGGHAVQFAVTRDGKDLPLIVTPKYEKAPDGKMTWMIGASVESQEGANREGVIGGAGHAFHETIYETQQIGTVLVGLFSGKVSVHDLAGPVGIVQLSGEAAKSGPMTLLFLTAAISLNLGLLNLLPIPILDGGHVLMLAIEGLLRRELSIAFKERFVQVGLVFLLSVFAFVMYSDILRVIQGHGH
ncbi:MAG TPA: RIP metalloprotease RseP [Candidatus Acidoferrales bacterium]|jgi:regulator of sigma E protease|nr:RIP metalloprotease RseP [Candidatus Acidoferrales bacterium]